MATWSNYPGSAISSGMKSVFWLACGPGIAMYLGVTIAEAFSGNLLDMWNEMLLFAPLLPVLAIISLFTDIFSDGWLATLVVPMLLAIPWFWFDGSRRTEAFFLIVLLSGVSASVHGLSRDGPLQVVYVLAVCVSLYALIRFRSQLLSLVVRELASEGEDEEEWQEEQAGEEDGEEGESTMRNPGRQE